MNYDALRQALAEASPDTQTEALMLLLSAHASPVFGAAKAVEHEVAAFLALQRLGLLSEQPDEYELVMTLRVTKAKARNLLYQVALRQRQGPDETNAALRALLSQPRVAKDGDKILIEVPDPLRMDCLRQRVRQLGFISDGSFSGSLAKVPTAALAALVADLIPVEDQTAIKDQLRAQGIQGDDLASMISAVLGQFGKRVAGSAGERVAERIGGKLGDFLCDGASSAFDWVCGVKGGDLDGEGSG